MSSEIPISTETEETDCPFDPITTRVIDILRYQNEYPEEDWKKVPELVYLDIEFLYQSEDTSSIKDFDIFNYINYTDSTKSGLYIALYYIPSKIPLRRLNRIKPKNWEVKSLIIPEGEETKIIRDLRGKITLTTFEMSEPSEEEIEETINRLGFMLTPREKRVLKIYSNQHHQTYQDSHSHT